MNDSSRHALLPAVFLGDEDLFEQLEQSILTRASLFDPWVAELPAADNETGDATDTAPDGPRHPPPRHPPYPTPWSNLLFGSLSQTSADSATQTLSDTLAGPLPLPPLYDLLAISFSHLPYLAPSHLALVPNRFPLGATLSAMATDHQTAPSLAHDAPLPWQKEFFRILDVLHDSNQPTKKNRKKKNRSRSPASYFLQHLVDSLTCRSLLAIDINILTAGDERARLGRWRQRLLTLLTKRLQHYKKSIWRGYNIYDHVATLHRLIALDLYHHQAGGDNHNGPSRDSWLRRKKIDYHLLELSEPPNRRVLATSPFLLLLNLSALIHWLSNQPVMTAPLADAPIPYGWVLAKQWRKALTPLGRDRDRQQLFDHYPVYGEVLKKIDEQLRQRQPYLYRWLNKKINPAANNSKTDKEDEAANHGLHPGYMLMGARPWSVAMLTQQPTSPKKIFLQRHPPSLILPWQKPLTAIGAFDLSLKKNSWYESGVWLPLPQNPQWGSGDIFSFIGHGDDSHAMRFFYIDNMMRVNIGHLAAPRLLCQKFLLPDGELLAVKKIYRRTKGQRLMVERRLFLPDETGNNPSPAMGDAPANNITDGHQSPNNPTNKIALSAMERITAAGGIDFFCLLPLSPDVRAFGKSNSTIIDMERHWHKKIMPTNRDNAARLVKPLVPMSTGEERIEEKINRLQEIFLQSKHNQGGRFVANGARLSLIKGWQLTPSGVRPCQVIMLSGQTLPGETLINWRLERLS